MGLYWTPKSDTLTYKVVQNTDEKITKRSILSETSKMFDPIGLVAPVVITAKILNQHLWTLKLDWDTLVPTNIAEKWKNYCIDVNNLNNLQIHRKIRSEVSEKIWLHGFGDASEKAYGACIYVRSNTKAGDYETHLFCSKSKVAPLKKTSLARLELCAAKLLSNLMERVKIELSVPDSNIFYWSDSTIVLSWLSEHPSKWGTFVANRVAEVQEITKGGIWRHVQGKENPADLVSRGMKAEDILKSDLWWLGPAWLKQHEGNWPKTILELKPQEVPERKKNVLLSSVEPEIPFKRNGSYKRLKMGIARILYQVRKIIHRRKNQGNLENKIISEDLKEAELWLLKVDQKHFFAEEFTDLNKKKYVKKSSQLFKLNPFIEESTGLIRVGSRLSNAEIQNDRKYPIILHSKSHLAKILVEYEHERLLHIGAQGLLYSIRQKFWILSGRSLCKQIVFKCSRCFRSNPKPGSYMMGSLPKTRTELNRAFVNVGLDYAGPFTIKTSPTRKSTTMKSWVCLFVCFGTKAVHLELVSSLSSECFIAALKRFLGRRGLCQNIYSDNATTFTGAYKDLKEIASFVQRESEKKELQSFFDDNMIKWNFIPPYAAHFGGLWEAGIKSVKTHMKKILNTKILTYEEFSTVLIQIEAVLNSRPICQVSEDASDPIALSPGHFLIGEPLTTLQEFDIQEKKENLLKRWQLVTQMTQHFWNRWSKEYISTLHNRSKWLKDGKSLQVGELVLIRDEKLPPMTWLTGIIETLHTGKDNKTRVVTIRTKKGLIRRAITHICPLPKEDD